METFPPAPWMTQQLREDEANMNLARSLAAKSGAKDDRERATRMQRDMRKKMAGAEETWRKKLAGKSKGNPKITWSQLKEWAGWHGDKTPRALKDKNGQVTRSTKSIVEILSVSVSLCSDINLYLNWRQCEAPSPSIQF